MHIKAIVIRGFKSYKDEVRMDLLSPKHNVVGAPSRAFAAARRPPGPAWSPLTLSATVGRNGTGKSNFFDAIRFVLCDDKFYNMTHAERQHLLYQGPGPTDILSSYVEIHFDNADGRFPIERDEVVLRRSIGLKKDEYFLDKKHVSKQDVLSLLESAGFSRANPYYIVQQGRVNALTLMRDEQRLDLLKEVAGTSVYEQRRSESEKIMAETAGKRAKVAEVLTYIDERLRELEEEKSELEQYRALDKERRAIEYAYYDSQYTQTSARLDACEAERQAELERANNVHDEAADAREQLAGAEQRAAALRTAATRGAAELAAADAERRELRATHAKLERELADAREQRSASTSDAKETRAQLKQVQQTIKTTERRLASAKPAFERHAESERALREQLASTERRLTELYAKQGRAAQFKSRRERDAWIDGEIARLEAARGAHNEQIAALEAEQAKARDALAALGARVETRERGAVERRAALERTAKTLNELRMRRDTLAAERKELWRDGARVSAELSEQRSEETAAARTLESSVSRAVSVGLDAVRRIVLEQQIDGVFGPLIELISTDREFATAVQVAARGALFHIVVDSDATAERVLRAFNAERVKGRVSFIPLNRVDGKQREYPNSPDVRPLVDAIKCEPMFRPAVQHVFGKTLVCRSLEVAAMNAKQHKLDCLTLDGDQVERKGALTGGFSDPRRSWLASMERVKQCRGALQRLDAEHRKNSEALKSLDAQISELLGEIESRETESVTLRDALDQLQHDVRSLARERDAMQAAATRRDAALDALRAAVAPLAANIDALRAERALPLHSKLSADESAELHRLQEQQSATERELATAAAARADAARQTTELTALLTENLQRRRDELQARADDDALRAAGDDCAPLEHELKLAHDALSTLDARVAELERAATERAAEQKKIDGAIASLQSGDSVVARRLLDESKRVERLQQQRSLLLRQRDEYARKIRELGALPDAELAATLAKLSQSELLKRLRTVNDKLRKYSHVNKKAADQYVNFTDQRTNLIRRQKELDDGAQSIDKLVDSLDRKKDEAIERTFKAVAKHFRIVFRELVPDGTASLTMQTRDPSSLDSSSQSMASQGSASNRISRYTGIGIKVSFAEGSETVHIQQLSGGQKSLVALALIFAIQRSDPAPFYLFDEIDAALDATHRSAVASMIKEQSKNTQFLTTTFRPELLTHAKKFYGVSFDRQKVSRVQEVTRVQALSVVEEEQRAAEAAR